MDIYSFDENSLKIVDSELDISHESTFDPVRIPDELRNGLKLRDDHVLRVFRYSDGAFVYDVARDNILDGEYLLTYPSGNTKLRSFYRNGKLHGPSIFYGEEGRPLIEAWYLEGNAEGRVVGHYGNGAEAYIQRFREGQYHGKQEYWYENGNVKTLMNYVDGELDGEVLLYYPNKKLKRKLVFAMGKCLSS